MTEELFNGDPMARQERQDIVTLHVSADVYMEAQRRTARGDEDVPPWNHYSRSRDGSVLIKTTNGSWFTGIFSYLVEKRKEEEQIATLEL